VAPAKRRNAVSNILEDYRRDDKKINFHLVPLSHLDASNCEKNKPTTINRYADWNGLTVSIYDVFINGEKIDVGRGIYGIGMSLKPGTYTVKAGFCIFDYYITPPCYKRGSDKRVIHKYVERETTFTVGDEADCYLVYMASAYTTWKAVDVYREETFFDESFYKDDTMSWETIEYKDFKWKIVSCKEKYELFVTDETSLNGLCRYWDLAEKPYDYSKCSGTKSLDNSRQNATHNTKKGGNSRSMTVIGKSSDRAVSTASKDVVKLLNPVVLSHNESFTLEFALNQNLKGVDHEGVKFDESESPNGLKTISFSQVEFDNEGETHTKSAPKTHFAIVYDAKTRKVTTYKDYKAFSVTDAGTFFGKYGSKKLGYILDGYNPIYNKIGFFKYVNAASSPKEFSK